MKLQIRHLRLSCLKSLLPIWLALLSIWILPFQSTSAEAFVPPSKPHVAPFIAEKYPNDLNGDRVEDQLLGKAERALSLEKAALTADQKSSAQAQLAAMMDVELVFRDQITQGQINAFQAQGGQITYLYKAVSYGWNGRIPLRQVPAIPGAMGNTLLLVQEAKQAKLHLDTATRTGRVRPIWASGFAGNLSGFSGNTNITIAICDTGTDESHTDLNGRRAYWHDFSTDAAASPIDVVQHGSHVMGIATGTGAASGSGTSTLMFTDEGTLSGVPSGNFFPSAFELPAVSVTVTLTARWNGGGSSTLHLAYHTKGVSGSYSSQASTTGPSPLTLTLTFTPLTTRSYTPALLSNGAMTEYVVASQVSNYPGLGDGFNKLRGVAPSCRWACAKVFTSAGSGLLSWTDAAVDDLVANRSVNNIKVINLSLGANGNPGLDPTTRQKINTAVNNGIVVAASAGNDGGTSQVDDPGRAAMALTVAAANDVNQLTDYTSEGFASPGSTLGQEEDYKPDLMAPGGSGNYYSAILSVDSNSGDGSAFVDQQANDYYNIQGTSMSSPFAAGCAALVIDALQQSGVTWDFNSSQHSRYVKMVLCATASESNANRESGANNPTLQRASAGPNGFPAGKDQFEGYGMINPDAAVEAVSQTYTNGTTMSATLGPGVTDRRVWARKVSLTTGQNFSANLTVPGGGDFDLYLYSATPSAYGTPVILASSTQAGNGIGEAFSYLPGSNDNALVVVKRISGTGTFSLVADVPPAVNFASALTNGAAPLTVSFINLTTGATNYNWLFGDGNTSSAVNPTNIYTNAGTYTVTLTAVGLAGTNSLVRTNYIVVTNPPATLVADFVADTTNGAAPLTVFFTNLSSGATNYSWDFGDGNTSTALSPANTYTNAGSYAVSLTAIGTDGTNVLTRFNYIVVTNVIFVLGAIPVTGAPYLEDFDSMGAAGTTAPLGWYVGTGTGAISGTNVTVGDGSSNASGNYNFGSSGSSDRALGSLAANSSQRDTEVRFVNVSGATILSFTISYTGEQWHVGGNGAVNNDLVMQFSTDGLSFVPMGAQFDFNTPLDSGPAGALDGNTPPNRVTGISGTYTPGSIIANGQTFYLRWVDVDNQSLDNAMAVDDFAISFTLSNPPPPVVAEFTGSPTNGIAPLTVSFTNLSSGASGYSWDFGSGQTSTAANPGNTYTNAGSYTVTLTAIGAVETNILARTNYIVVTNPPPPVLADFTGSPTNGVAPLTVSFTNLSTGATSYSWDFGDGQTSPAINPENTYTNAGSYTVTLTAIGTVGTNILARTNYIVATNPPPPVLADFTGSSTNGVAPLTVSFTNLSSGATSYSWDFGDGQTSPAINPENTYTNAGSYTVTLTASGAGGTNSLARTNYIVVTNSSPTVLADFTGSPTSGLAPLTVSFTNLSTGATSYSWDFSDGQTSTVVIPGNTYTNAGNYTVTLTAIGAGGTNTLARTNYILVVNPAQLVVMPASLDFGMLFTNTTGLASFVISNAGAAELSATATLMPDPFSILDPNSVAVSNFSFAVPALSSTNLNVSFTPAALGQFSNVVVFVTDFSTSTNTVLGQGVSAPLIAAPTLSGSDLFFTFETISGKVYAIEYKDSLDDPIWQMLQSLTGDGTPNTITVSTSASFHRFFRLRAE